MTLGNTVAGTESQVFMLSVPLTLRPVELVSGDHRRRARARRLCWDEIVQSTRLSMAKYRTLSDSKTTSETPSCIVPLWVPAE